MTTCVLKSAENIKRMISSDWMESSEAKKFNSVTILHYVILESVISNLQALTLATSANFSKLQRRKITVG